MEDFRSLTEKRLSGLRIPCQIISHENYGRKSEIVAPFFGVGKGGILKVLTFVSESDQKKAVLAILSRGKEVSMPLLKGASKISDLRLAKSAEVKALTGMEIGGVSPFAQNLPVFIDSRVLEEKTVLLSAGSPEESVSLSGKDVERGCPGARTTKLAE